MSNEIRELTPEELFRILKCLNELRDNFSSFKYNNTFGDKFVYEYGGSLSIKFSVERHE